MSIAGKTTREHGKNNTRTPSDLKLAHQASGHAINHLSANINTSSLMNTHTTLPSSVSDNVVPAHFGAMEYYTDSILAVIMATSLMKYKAEIDMFNNRDSHESDDSTLSLLAPAMEIIYTIYKFLDAVPLHPMTSLFQSLADQVSGFLQQSVASAS